MNDNRSKTWFTSDFHLGHHRLYETGFRKFSCAQECEEKMLDNFSCIRKQDNLYIAGDLTLSANYDYVAEFLSQINGNKIVILGNHDRQTTLDKLKSDGVIANYHPWKGVRPVLDSGQTVPVFVTHFPLLEWHVGNEFRYNLHGHMHGLLAAQDKCPMRYDVGVDANSYTPVTLDQILSKNEFSESIRNGGVCTALCSISCFCTLKRLQYANIIGDLNHAE